ncbi:MAG: ERCC4 domain-containing protein [archaeon]|nr:ERCC4 domain-containing protein [archaeon]
MLHDIFKTKNKITTLPKLLPKIIVDTREKNSLVIANLSKESEIILQTLEIGDYLIGNTIIERKTFSDFISSMLNKRLIEQLRQMQKYENKILILEGKDFEEFEEKETKINPNAIRGMMLSISLDFKTPIIFTKDTEDTAKFLIVLAKQQLKKKTEFTLHSKKPLSKKEQKQYIIESFPNIGPKTAKILLQKFNSIKNIINAPQEDLEKEICKKAESIIELRD